VPFGATAYRDILTPNAEVPPGISVLLRFIWIFMATVLWILLKPAVMPTPLEVLASIPTLLTTGGLGDALKTSFITNILALAASAAIALPIAYLSRVPVVRPLAFAVSQLRFLSPAVFLLLLLFMVGSGPTVKIALVVLGEVFFLATGMINVVQGIPQAEFDEARVLRMSEWMSMWYVTIRGTLDRALELIRDNAAIGWSMLMMVEGIVRSEGGVGVLLLNQERYMRFDAVYGIALMVLIVGVGQDWILKEVRGWACPHTRL
jgi:NitT/TauT family transport system permease protein